MSNTAVDHVRFVPQSGNRLGQFISQFIQIVTAHILEFDLFEILPDSLDWVQIGCVACSSLDVDVSGGTLRQKGFDFAIVNWGSIPHNQQLRANLSLELLEKANYISTRERPSLPTHVHLALRRDGANQRPVLMGHCLVQDGRLPDGGIGTHGSRQQIKAGFVEKEQGTLLC